MAASTPTSQGDGTSPRLSVVVPVHNVAPYLRAALDSVLNQSYRDLEVVVVDDGATDDSAAVATTYAQRDPRVRVVHQANAGLGAARNAGVSRARGEFLTFADGDDVVPPGSYEAMMSTIARTGSDMVVGTLERLGARHRRAGRLMRENHSRRRESVTLTEMPLMLADVFAVNKVFRRSFWDHAGLEFPSGTHYEDQPAMTRAFLQAERFDVLPRTVYLWRRRADRSSITQNRHRIEDLRDRMETKRETVRAVLSVRPELTGLLHRKILPVDLWSYFEASVISSGEYWELLRDATREFWNASTVPFEQTHVPVHQRLMGALVVEDRRQDLARVVTALNDRAREVPLAIKGQEVVCRISELGVAEASAPAGSYTLAPHETMWEARVLDTTWNESQLTLHGFAVVENLPTGERSTSLSATAVGPGGCAVPLRVRRRPEPRATRRVGRPGQNFDDCGFDLDLDLEALAEHQPPVQGRPFTWRLRFERQVEGLRREGGLTGYRAAAVDRRWRPVSSRVNARLRDVGGSLVVDLRRADSVHAHCTQPEPVAVRREGSQSA